MESVGVHHMSEWPDPSEIKLIRNRFTKERGEPKLNRILCADCGTAVILYQKDGGGSLLRCYYDRIHFPKDLNLAGNLTCSKCMGVMGTPMIYKPEARPAFRLIPGKFMKEEV